MASKSARRRARIENKAFGLFVNSIRPCTVHERWNDTIARAQKAWATGQPVAPAKAGDIPLWLENGDW